MGGKWEFPGGKVESGETDADAALREYDEEFGLAISVGPVIGESMFRNKGKDYELAVIMVTFNGEPLALREHDRYGWVDIDSLSALDLADSDRSLLPFLGACRTYERTQEFL
jgi:8-oxo-dGTP diphosphatase